MGKAQEAIQILKKANRNDEAKQKKRSVMEDRILAADAKEAEAQARHGEHDA